MPSQARGPDCRLRLCGRAPGCQSGLLARRNARAGGSQAPNPEVAPLGHGLHSRPWAFCLGSPRPSSQRLLTLNVNALRAEYAGHIQVDVQCDQPLSAPGRDERDDAQLLRVPQLRQGRRKVPEGGRRAAQRVGDVHPRAVLEVRETNRRVRTVCANVFGPAGPRSSWATLWSGLALGHCSGASDSGSPTDRTSLAPRARRHQQTYAKQPNTGPIIDYLLTIASTVNAAAE